VEEIAISAAQLTRTLAVPANRISQIITGKTGHLCRHGLARRKQR
jgi:plasmid maintenance system antidote protein VapI